MSDAPAPDPALVERVLNTLSDGGVIPQPHIVDTVLIPAIAETLAALRESGRLVEWRPIDDDTPLSADVLLAIKEPVGWTVECGWAGGKNTCAPASGYSNGWRHGRASHWSPRPAPPATAATEVE